jgi:hypothetical protein
MESMTVKELLAYVGEYRRALGSRENHSLDLTLLNQGRRERARAMGGIYSTWDNDTGGSLTVSGNSCAMPKEMLEVESVWWDGDQLRFRATIQMDRSLGDWRNDSSSSPMFYSTEGRRIFFDVTSSGSDVGLLVVHGWGLGADYSEAEGAANPLDDMAGTDDLADAYFAIARLPVIREPAMGSDPAAIRAAAEENARRAGVKVEFGQLWDAAVQQAASDGMSRRGRPYSGR